MERIRRTSVFVIKKRSLFWHILAILSTSIYLLFFLCDWWMGCCAFVVGLLQIIFLGEFYSSGKKRSVPIDELSSEIIRRRFIIVVHVTTVVLLFILNLFPLFVTFSRQIIPDIHLMRYEGGLFCFLFVGLTEFVLIIFSRNFLKNAYHISPKYVKDIIKHIELTGKTVEEVAREELKRKKKEEEAKEKAKEEKWNKILDKIGGADITIDVAGKTVVVVNEENKYIVIKNKIYEFKDILGFETKDDTEVITSSYTTPPTTITRTNTGSMMGRTVVGGLVGGTAGALLGGLTAVKASEFRGGVTTTTTKTKHKYTINITTNNLKKPVVSIKLGEDNKTTEQLAGILSVIVNMNK